MFCLLATTTLMAVVVLVSCSKPGGGGGVDQQKRSEEFKASISNQGYKPVAFYSDKPIDYITTDAEVRSETDLWKYVKDYIKDDRYVFGADGVSVIYQNTLKVNWSNADTLHFNYGITPQDKYVYINFVNYDYYPSVYKLESFNDSEMIFYVDGPNGSKLFSKYVRAN